MNGSVYLERYSYGPQLIKEPPEPNLEIVVVIPCYFEPDLISTLQSLVNCTPTAGKVEILVVVNQSEADTHQVVSTNEQVVEQANQWTRSQSTGLSFHILHQTLPKKHAGVGLARKIGMDEAVRRFRHLNKDGIIVCLDADSTCSVNYLKALEEHFAFNKDTPGCSIYFEHALTGPLPSHVYKAITAYELHLRYYTHGLRYSGLPCSYQTVGSSMAVKSSAYEKQGGMNKRQAGEDFYFLQKIMKLGGFTELNTATVFPSSRLSTRVPFGTGKAMIDAMENVAYDYDTYHPNIFLDLRSLVTSVEPMYQANSSNMTYTWNRFSTGFQEYMTKNKFQDKIQDLNQRTSTLTSFKSRFFQWCDGLFAFKYANFASSKHYAKVDISEAARWLLKEMYGIELESAGARNLLEVYRRLDRGET